jgi:hypothetical protein
MKDPWWMDELSVSRNLDTSKEASNVLRFHESKLGMSYTNYDKVHILVD